uniref:F-box domain-containing protein n=1 Tax=Triticum urartu TaxID=4572 RepID=A0A8R7NWF5_TRIUA
MVKGRRSKRRRCPVANLTDDLIVEILSRLPARSVCRFKCVSTTWRDLISHPVNRMKDTGGKACRNIPVPVPGEQEFGFIQLSQGRLHYANFEADHEDKVVRLVAYVLEDYDKQEWTLKHTAEASHVVGSHGLYEPGWVSYINLAEKFEWVAIHPDCNMIFYTVEWDKTLMSYDIDRRQVQEICTLGEDTRETYLPYVSLFSELQTLHT